MRVVYPTPLSPLYEETTRLLLFGDSLHILDREAYLQCSAPNGREKINLWQRTWWEALLELLSLLRVVEGESVEVAVAPDLELGLGLATRYS